MEHKTNLFIALTHAIEHIELFCCVVEGMKHISMCWMVKVCLKLNSTQTLLPQIIVEYNFDHTDLWSNGLLS